MYVWVNSFLSETAAWAYGAAGRFAFRIQAKDVPSWLPIQLNTAAFALVCPKLPLTFPNTSMSLRLAPASAVPLVPFVTPGVGMNMTAFFSGTFFVELPNGTELEAFSLNTTAKLAVRGYVSSGSVPPPSPPAMRVSRAAGLRSVPVLQDATVGLPPVPQPKNITPCVGTCLHFEFVLAKIELAVLSSSFGAVAPLGLQAYFNWAIVDTLVNQLNLAGGSGLPIPTMEGVEFVHPELVWDTNTIRIDTDIRYVPPY